METGADVVGLRPVRETDLEIFFEHQRDPEAAAVARFPAREREPFLRHWRTTILPNPGGQAMTVTCGDAVAGNILSWAGDEHVLVGYWIGREYWGRGIATAALAAFLTDVEPRRPLHAHVASTNAGSIRVLEKCGFELVERATGLDTSSGVDVEELLMRYAG